MLLKRKEKRKNIYYLNKKKGYGIVQSPDGYHQILRNDFHGNLITNERREFYFKNYEQGYTGYHYYLNDNIVSEQPECSD